MGMDGISSVSARLGGEGETSLVRVEEGDWGDAGWLARRGSGCLGVGGTSWGSSVMSMSSLLRVRASASALGREVPGIGAAMGGLVGIAGGPCSWKACRRGRRSARW